MSTYTYHRMKQIAASNQKWAERENKQKKQNKKNPKNFYEKCSMDEMNQIFKLS